MVSERDQLELTLAEFLGRTAAATPAPGAGAASAAAVALAAGLTAMAAGLSRRHLPEADELVAEALELQARAAPLGQRDAEVYGDVLRARGRPHDDPERAEQVRQALSRATDVPLEIAVIGSEVLRLSADVASRGNPNLRGDVLTGRLLAQAGVRSAGLLVRLNLGDSDDPRLARAAELARAARDDADLQSL